MPKDSICIKLLKTVSTSCGVYISQPIRFARVSSHVDDLNTVIKF